MAQRVMVKNTIVKKEEYTTEIANRFWKENDEFKNGEQLLKNILNFDLNKHYLAKHFLLIE